MKCMSRNRVKFYYALYEGRELVTDEYGNILDEYEVKHGKPCEFYANISAEKGETQIRQFGENESYDKVIVMDNSSPPIDEYSVLWVDNLPVLNDDGTTDTPYDYIVKKVSRSINSVSIAIRKVNVSG